MFLIAEKHTEGSKGRACFWTVRKAVKRHFKTKVCPLVPDRESSQENPQTFRPEPTAVTDALESQPVLGYVQATQSSAVVSAESSSNAFEDLPVDVPEQQNKPTAEKHTEGRKGRACFRTVRKAVKRHFKTLKSKVCPRVHDQEPSQENPQTSRPEPTAVTDPLESQPVLDYVQATQIYFCSLYKVGVELLVEYFSCLHEGIRRSDGHKVLVKFAGRRWLENRYRCRGDIPPCYEAEIMFALQRPPSCDHIIRLYDWFPLQDHDILVMEHPYPCVTLADFILQNTGRLDEEITRRIMFQLIVAERHCLDRGVLHDTCLREILINTDTLQIKLMQFARAKFTAPADDITFLDPMIRVATILETARNLRAVLGALIEEFSPWDLQNLSIETSPQQMKEKETETTAAHPRFTPLTWDASL
ncbi:hypothetical protein Q8A67_025816 [Cirrhinus molitorella]|uniref:non-specific serine/threonine protein kinase n=1 Tax=Cirrhinus molitorella TaxID=172907 RepID=A0AA88P116_9TELE|nr:hypothetical protein Q8A67_025816 [Cirrhinus molitorella]